MVDNFHPLTILTIYFLTSLITDKQRGRIWEGQTDKHTRQIWGRRNRYQLTKSGLNFNRSTCSRGHSEKGAHFFPFDNIDNCSFLTSIADNNCCAIFQCPRSCLYLFQIIKKNREYNSSFDIQTQHWNRHLLLFQINQYLTTSIVDWYI